MIYAGGKEFIYERSRRSQIALGAD